MGNKEEQAAHELRVLNRVNAMVSKRDLDSFYGFTAEDVDRFCGAFQSVTQNPETTFPDFYSETSCIELFKISSSELTERGGAAQMMQDGKLKERVRREIEQAAKGELPARRTYREMHPSHSYEWLSKSLHSQCLGHAKSLKKCERIFDTKVFVIECDEVDLECCFLPTGDADVNGICPGDLWPTYERGKQSGLYRLSRDKQNLLWLQEHLSDVDFLVFAGLDHAEAINHHRADVLAALLPWKLVAAPALAITLSTYECLSVPAKEPKEDE